MDCNNSCPEKTNHMVTVKIGVPVKIDEPPYKHFLGIISFVASLGIVIAITSFQTLGCASSFLGSSTNATLASLQYSSTMFTWSTCMYALGLMLSLATLIMLTDDDFQKAVNGDYHEEHIKNAKYFVLIKTLVSLGFVAAGTALVGEGIKIAVGTAGSILQWGMLVIAVVSSVPMFVIKQLVKKKKNEVNMKKNSTETPTEDPTKGPTKGTQESHRKVFDGQWHNAE